MGQLAESSARVQKLLESGQWKYVTETPAPPAIPAPTNAYPAAPNQYLRSPLPPDMWQDPDAQRQFHSAAIPQYRLAPLPANTSPVAGAQAASQAIQIVQSTPASSTSAGVTSVGLKLPTALFVAPVAGSPITSAGVLAPVFANEPINTVFAGAPSSAGAVNVDAAATAAGTQDPFSASVNASGANELVLTFVYPTGTVVPPAGFTSLGSFGSPSPYLGSKITTAAGTVTASGQAGNGSGAIWEQMLLAFKNTGSTPPTIRQVGTLSGLNQGLNTGNPFASAVLASSSIVVFVYSRSTGGSTPSAPSAFTITDNQGGGTYVESLNVFNTTAVFPNQQSIFAQCFTTPSVTAGTYTASVTSTLNGALGWSQANCVFLEIVGLGSPIFTPIFRQLVPADIPNLDASIITTGKLALARGGTNADLSATGGTSQFLRQNSSGAAVTVVQPAFTDISGAATFAQLPAVQSTVQSSVSFSATPTFTATNVGSFVITLTGNVTSSTISGGTAGQSVVFVIKQDGAGAHTFVWPTNMKGTGTIAGTANGYNVQPFTYDGTNWLASSAMQSFT